MSQFKPQVGDVVTTLSGAVIFITAIDVLENAIMSKSGMRTFHEGVVFSAANQGYEYAGTPWKAEASEPLRLVANIRDVLRIMEQNGVSLEPAIKPLSEIEQLRAANAKLQERLLVLETGSGVDMATKNFNIGESNK
jgi:hypothetical protein